MKSKIVEDQDKEKPEEYKGDKEESKISSLDETKANAANTSIEDVRELAFHDA
jgi:hypothetical protein